MQHRGRAVVFENIEHYNARIDDPALDVDATACWCSRTAARRATRAWPKSATWGCRRRCCRPGVTDMVRISDARMSGTAYGTAVLHVVAGSGGRRAARARARRRHDRARRRTARRLQLDVSDDELARAARGVAAAGSRSCRPAATRSCTSSTCSRPIRAPTSISSSAAAATT